VHAQDEARLLRHNYIGTEHLLLGLLREEEGIAAHALGSLGVTLDDVRAQVGRIIGEGDDVHAGQIPFTPRAKRVLELSLRESQALGQTSIGTEHLLLGLAREGNGVAMRILLDQGIDPETVRDATVGTLSGREPVVAERHRHRPVPAKHADASLLVAGAAIFAVALALGILLGFLIWH
jgi:ATP-dependent Clp protease ATP-binding subunit ClpC